MPLIRGTLLAAVAHYQLEERIGQGALVEVFRARAIADRGFEKPVVIKRLLPQLTRDRSMADRLIAEANLLAMLRHRNIRQVFDVGADSDNQFFLVMEFVDGTDLDTLWQELDRRRLRLPLDLVLWIGAQLCDALAHAHEALDSQGAPLGLVHRNLSPAHVLLSRYGEVKIADFGTPVRVDATSVTNAETASTGRFAYLSPEQARGGGIDARSDLFALGAMLWEFVAGRRLFSGLRDVDALRAVRTHAVPALSSIDASLPAPVQDLIHKALAPQPDQRFSSARELAAALRAARYRLQETSADPAAEMAFVVESLQGAALQGGERFAAQAAAHPQLIQLHAIEASSAPIDLKQLRDELEEFAEQHSKLIRLSSDDLELLDPVGETGSVAANEFSREEVSVMMSLSDLSALSATGRGGASVFETTRSEAVPWQPSVPMLTARLRTPSRAESPIAMRTAAPVANQLGRSPSLPAVGKSQGGAGADAEGESSSPGATVVRKSLAPPPVDVTSTIVTSPVHQTMRESVRDRARPRESDNGFGDARTSVADRAALELLATVEFGETFLTTTSRSVGRTPVAVLNERNSALSARGASLATSRNRSLSASPADVVSGELRLGARAKSLQPTTHTVPRRPSSAANRTPSVAAMAATASIQIEPHHTDIAESGNDAVAVASPPSGEPRWRHVLAQSSARAETAFRTLRQSLHLPPVLDRHARWIALAAFLFIVVLTYVLARAIKS